MIRKNAIFTISHSDKFAGAFSNDNCKKIKSDAFITPFQYLRELTEIDEKIQELFLSNPTDPKLQSLALDKRAVSIDYQNSLDLQFNHQESWILNSIPSQNIELC